MLLDASKELSLDNPLYLKQVEHFIWDSFLMDSDPWDITTQTFVTNPFQRVTAEVRANQAGVLAGIQEAKWICDKLGIDIVRHRADGKEFKKGQVVFKMRGPAGAILSVERTLLNMIQRMSGIAYYTNRVIRKVPKRIKLLATRKTFWGMLDKRAVALGGGGTHRLTLHDAVLVKENHAALSLDYSKSLRKVFKLSRKVRFVEVEVESPAEAENFLKVYEAFRDKYDLKGKVAVMLDDFKSVDIKKMAPRLSKAGLTVEVSGGVVEKTVKKYTLKGVDAISSGAITNNAPVIDMSLKVLKE